MFPNPDDLPCRTLQKLSLALVPILVFRQLSQPVILVRFWVCGVLRTAVPEASINEDCNLWSAENDVDDDPVYAFVESESKAMCMKCFPQRKLCSRVLVLDTTHYFRPGKWLVLGVLCFSLRLYLFHHLSTLHLRLGTRLPRGRGSPCFRGHIPFWSLCEIYPCWPGFPADYIASLLKRSKEAGHELAIHVHSLSQVFSSQSGGFFQSSLQLLYDGRLRRLL